MSNFIPDSVRIVALLLGSFFVTLIVIPRIIGVVKYKRLMENPNERSSHKGKVPSLGGVGFFISIGLGFYFLQDWDQYRLATSILPGLLVLFIIGLKDDLVVLSPRTKLLAQLAALSFIVFHPAFQIHDLNNFLGITNVSVFITIPLATFVGLFIINAYNLIDGIDGLAAMIGMVIFGIYGLLFYLLDLYFFCGISALVIGTLAAFLRFNLSSKTKIFMGDTGSLIIGFLIAVATIRLFSIDPTILKKLPFQLENLPTIVIALLIIPIFDTARVFTIRIMNGKSPFSADRNHIHHLLIDNLKLTHIEASTMLTITNLLFCSVFLLMSVDLNNLILFGILLMAVGFFTYFCFRMKCSCKDLHEKSVFQSKLKKIKGLTNFLS